jgi:hypothetical protein
MRLGGSCEEQDYACVRKEIILNTIFRDVRSGGRRGMSHTRYERHEPSVKREQCLSDALVLDSVSLHTFPRERTASTNLITHQSNGHRNKRSQQLGYERWVGIQKLPETKYRI